MLNTKHNGYNIPKKLNTVQRNQLLYSRDIKKFKIMVEFKILNAEARLQVTLTHLENNCPVC